VMPVLALELNALSPPTALSTTPSPTPFPRTRPSQADPLPSPSPLWHPHSTPQLASGAVYSLHKTSTREHIVKTVASWGGGGRCEVLAEMKFDVPHMRSSTGRRVWTSRWTSFVW
jgi:hypothetical protein